jgi:hypothetical protein
MNLSRSSFKVDPFRERCDVHGAQFARWSLFMFSSGLLVRPSNHESRLKDPFEAVYLLFFQALQVTSSSLAAGAGMRLTLACFRWRPWYKGGKWLGLSKEALRDVIRIYYLIIPLLLIASAWEYLFP